jgi:acetyltransferase-like isoleucine patch superfamily enzyme
MGIDRPCIISTVKEGAEISIGRGCGFSGTVIGCASKIVIAENVRCGANTLITDTDWHTDDPRTGPDAPVKIGKGVWLGVNVTVLKGVVIGENTLVAAGSLVTRSLPANVVAGGIPAKVLKEINTHQSRLGSDQ